MANVNSNDLAGRSLISMVNRTKINTIYDFPYGEYRAQRTFFDELSRVQSSLVNDGQVELETGITASIDSTGGLLAIQIYMETLETRKESMSGMSKLGLSNEKKLWTLQN
jgi:fido (protein-threonine AMPylation protein)